MTYSYPSVYPPHSPTIVPILHRSVEVLIVLLDIVHIVFCCLPLVHHIEVETSIDIPARLEKRSL